MSIGLRFDIEPPRHGWATVRLMATGFQLEFAASYTPRDSISDLARATVSLLDRVPEQLVTWSAEPVEYDFRFQANGDRTRLEVHEFPDRRRRWRRVEVPLAVVEADTAAVARALWRGLRRLQGAIPTVEFEESWGHPFPTSVVERLGNQLRNQSTSMGSDAGPGATPGLGRQSGFTANTREHPE